MIFNQIEQWVLAIYLPDTADLVTSTEEIHYGKLKFPWH